MEKECVRWQRVDKYLKESSFSTSGETRTNKLARKISASMERWRVKCVN